MTGEGGTDILAASQCFCLSDLEKEEKSDEWMGADGGLYGRRLC